MDWDLIHTVLCIGRCGTLSAAARQLGVNQTTVARRLDAAEQAAGGPLFLRLKTGLFPTEAGALALEHAARMESAAAGFGQALRDANADLCGPVEVTATEGILTHLLAPALPKLHVDLPNISLVLTGGHESLDLSSRQADIALRLNRPQGEGLRGRKVADVTHAVYVASARSAEAATLPWLAYSKAFAALPESIWLAAQPGGGTPLLRSNSLAALCVATAHGLGRALLPCYAGDADPTLTRISEVEVSRDLWLVLHQDVARVARVRAVADWLANDLAAQRPRLLGV